ncbi:MAG: hypothetical protein LBD69_02205 [Puniceicoccales bacterium]|jgi:hypothetical protein|nr:hypothetical protein [Puniceicoccales bacterium]
MNQTFKIMLNSINANLSTGSLPLQNEELANQKNQSTQITAQRQDPLSKPAQDVVQAAQTATDIVVSSDAESSLKKTLGQIVIENTIHKREESERVEADTNLKRDIGSTDGTSAIGTVSMEGLPPAEINAKPKID